MVPSYAVPINYDSHFPEMQATVLASAVANLEYLNRNDLVIYNGAVESWTVRNTRNRELGLPVDAKPVQPPKRVLKTERDAQGTVWIWIDASTLLGVPCPDLPPVQTVLPNFTHVGVHFDGTDYWQCAADDTMPEGAKVKAPDGTEVVKIKLPFGSIYRAVK